MRLQAHLVEITLERATTTPTTIIPSVKSEGFEVEESACIGVVLHELIEDFFIIFSITLLFFT